MSDQAGIIPAQDDESMHTDVNSECPAGPTWLAPAVTFGVRVAVLAGLVLGGGAAIGGFGDALGGSQAEGTVCCPQPF
jgi:hypothetical protein